MRTGPTELAKKTNLLISTFNQNNDIQVQRLPDEERT